MKTKEVMKDRDIMSLARLILWLDSSDEDKERKARIISIAKDLGLLTENEAAELVLNYC